MAPFADAATALSEDMLITVLLRSEVEEDKYTFHVHKDEMKSSLGLGMHCCASSKLHKQYLISLRLNYHKTQGAARQAIDADDTHDSTSLRNMTDVL